MMMMSAAEIENNRISRKADFLNWVIAELGRRGSAKATSELTRTNTARITNDVNRDTYWQEQKPCESLMM